MPFFPPNNQKKSKTISIRPRISIWIIYSDIVGHEKSATLSYGLYSGGASFQQKRNAVEKIDYSFG